MAPWNIPALLQCLDQLQHALPRSTAIAVALVALLVGFLLGVWWRDRHGPKVAAGPRRGPPLPNPTADKSGLVMHKPPENVHKTESVRAESSIRQPASRPSVWAGHWWTSCHKHRRAYLIEEGCAECRAEERKA